MLAGWFQAGASKLVAFQVDKQRQTTFHINIPRFCCQRTPPAAFVCTSLEDSSSSSSPSSFSRLLACLRCQLSQVGRLFSTEKSCSAVKLRSFKAAAAAAHWCAVTQDGNAHGARTGTLTCGQIAVCVCVFLLLICARVLSRRFCWCPCWCWCRFRCRCTGSAAPPGDTIVHTGKPHPLPFRACSSSSSSLSLAVGAPLERVSNQFTRAARTLVHGHTFTALILVLGNNAR